MAINVNRLQYIRIAIHKNKLTYQEKCDIIHLYKFSYIIIFFKKWWDGHLWLNVGPYFFYKKIQEWLTKKMHLVATKQTGLR